MPYLSQKISKNPQQTQDFAQKLGQKLPPGTIFALSGDLGAGKTCFIQGLARGLGISQQIQSPSFVLVKVYPLAKKGWRNFYHLDLYRLAKKELDKSAICELIDDQKSIMAIEWAEKINNWLPFSRTIIFRFQHLSPAQRKITITCQGPALDKIIKMVYN